MESEVKLPQKYAYLFPWPTSTRRKSATSGRWRAGRFLLNQKSGLVSVSVVVTVKNDDAGVKNLFSDLEKQTVKADEVIVIAAEDYQNCTRGRGRNIGINKARNEIIAVTDVGCRPYPDWLQKLTTPLLNKEGDVASGFYKTMAETNLQKAIASYLAILPNKWSENYLPASRSIGFTKSAWKKVGGYPENAESGAEDLEFARRLRDDPNIKIVQVPEALVGWEVPNNLIDFAKDIYKHTMGNFEVGYWLHIWRNISVVARWILFVIWPWLLIGYLFWILGKIRFTANQIAMPRNGARNDGEREIATAPQRRFAMTREWLRTMFWLPVVQVVADASIIATMAVWGLEKLRLKGSAGLVD